MTHIGSPVTETGQCEGGRCEGGRCEGGRCEGGRQQAVRGSRLVRRRRVLLGAGVAAALLAIGGLIGASFVKSPQQLAADSAAPPPTVTTAAVVSQVLTSSVQMRGVVYPSTQYDVYAGSSSTEAVYISKLRVTPGDTITDGEQLAELDGEPLFVLAGPVPAWRDLTPGESGPDVTELQQALATLGYYDGGDTPGYFGSATGYAVSRYYAHLGYTAPSSGGLPGTDVVFLPSLPATVVAVNGATGEQPGQPFLELAPRGSLALTGELPPAYDGQVKSGLKVTIYDEVTGIHATGTVGRLGAATINAPAGAVVDIDSAPGSASSAASASSGSASSGSASSGSTGSGSTGSGSTGSGSTGSGSTGSGSSTSAGSSGATPFIPLTVHPSKPLAAALNGENVLVTVDTGRTEGPVLTVPVAAIVTRASGTSYVTLAGRHGKQTDVPVTPGISENGYVQVTPASSGALAAGDRVVVSG